jgi:glycosyltransferase involved in cell wall biosynthesis
MNDAAEQYEATGRPALSVVMPALNAAATIGEALASLDGQLAGLEIVLADGGSTDETVAIARRHPLVTLLEAPGSTIYQALNLAIAAAQAPIIAWLNADDLFLPAALAAALAAFAERPDAEIVRGRPEFRRSGPEGWGAHEHRIERLSAGPLSLAQIMRGPLAINSLVFRRTVLARIGPFDSSFRLAADRDWMLRAWRQEARVVELDRPFYRYRVHHGSSTLDPDRRNDARARAEHAAILRRDLPAALARQRRHPVTIELRRWHAVECALRLHPLLAHGSWRDAARLAAEAARLDAAWPLILAGRAAAAWAARRHRPG